MRVRYLVQSTERLKLLAIFKRYFTIIIMTYDQVDLSVDKKLSKELEVKTVLVLIHLRL